jgi:hypothetical protein
MSQPSTAPAASAYRMLDFIMVLACLFGVFWIFSHGVGEATGRALEIASWGTNEQIQEMIISGAYHEAILGYMAIFVLLFGLVLYGFWRQRGALRFWLVAATIAGPSLFIGIIFAFAINLTSDLKSRINTPMEAAGEPVMVARQMWAAVLWSTGQVGSLPAWTRGGQEQWPLPGGGELDILISQHNVEVRHPGVSGGVACKSLLSALYSERPPTSGSMHMLINGIPASQASCDAASNPGKEIAWVASISSRL